MVERWCWLLGRSGNVALNREVTDKALYFSLAHLTWMFFAAMKFQITQNPVTIGLFRPVGIVMIAQHFFDLLHQPGMGVWFKFWVAFHFVNS
jgi:hypothetical protein